MSKLNYLHHSSSRRSRSRSHHSSSHRSYHSSSHRSYHSSSHRSPSHQQHPSQYSTTNRNHYSIDTESEKTNNQLSLIQINSIPFTPPSLVMLFELKHLPDRNSQKQIVPIKSLVIKFNITSFIVITRYSHEYDSLRYT
ncbi:unnamed protein product [Rotaria magnacalcarata]|uniref:Uncharacterized protein n=1 Tax=Rotaria magnacalcarata TaxID=392030 RepID=A0A816VGS6_9BILA|nr:unnamed protein product [Rotaria magnacalcarata]